MDWNSVRNSPGIKNISSLATSTITGNAISAVFWLYLARLLGEESYGELGYLIGIAGIASNIALLGGEYVMTVYTAKGKDIQSVLYLISLISSGISALVLFMIFQNVGLSAYVIGFVIFTLTIAEIQGRKLFKKFAMVYVLQKIFFVLISFSLYQFIGIEGILLGYGLSYVPFLKRMYVSLVKKNYDFKFLREKSGYIANNYTMDLAGAIKGQIDKLIIAPMFGYALLGNYYLGLQVVSILSIIPGVVFVYILPQDASGSSTVKLKMYTIIGSVILAILGIFLAPVVIPLVFPEYVESLSLIPILSISIISATITSMYTSKFLGIEKSSYVLIGLIVSAISLVIGIIILGEVFQVVGLAIAFLLASFIEAGFLAGAYYIKRKSFEGIKNNDQ